MKKPHTVPATKTPVSSTIAPFVPPRRIYDVLCNTPSALELLMREAHHLYLLRRNNGISFDGILNSGEDLFQETIVRISNSRRTCTSTGAAIAFARRTAANLLSDSARKYAHRSKVVITLTPLDDDDEEALQRAKEGFAASAAQQRALESEEMRELLAKARAELGSLDPINQALLAAIEDSVCFGIKPPSDKEVAEACGAKQNTVTVRRGKLKKRIRILLSRDLGYAAPQRPLTRIPRKGMKTPPFPGASVTPNSQRPSSTAGQ